MDQPTLFGTTAKVPAPIVNAIEGMAAQWAFGDKRTTQQNREARLVAEQCAELIARLKPVQESA